MDETSLLNFLNALVVPAGIAISGTGELCYATALLEKCLVDGDRGLIAAIVRRVVRQFSGLTTDDGSGPEDWHSRGRSVEVKFSLPGWRGLLDASPVTWRGERAVVLVFHRGRGDEAVSADGEARHREALRLLSLAPEMRSGAFDGACRLITRVATETLTAVRAGVWHLHGNRLVNEVAYDSRLGQHSVAEPFDLSPYPNYLVALSEERNISIPDIRTTAILRGIAGIRDWAGIRSMIDCPIRLGGELVGAVSIEHAGEPRYWTKEEQAFCASLADFAVIALESFRLRQSERRLATLVSNLPGTAFRCRNDYPVYTIEYVSEGFLEMTGYRPEDIIGGSLSFFDLVYPEDLPGVKAANEATLVVGKPLDATYRIVHKSGEVRWLWERSRVVEFDHGNPRMGIVEGFFSDVTERRRLEEAAAKSQATSKFFTNMSHELRTPLNGVFGLTTLLLETDLNPAQRQYAETILRSADALRHVVDDALDFSDAEGDRIVLLDGDFAPWDIIEDVCSLHAPKIRKKGLAFSLAIDPAVPELLSGDPDRIRQILANLLGNAVKFTSRGRIDVRCRLAEPPRPEEVVLRFEVADTGMGIPAERLKSIFEPFTQVDASAARRFGGTGLGLAICRKLAGLMGGEVGCESRNGAGSTFWFTARLGVARTLGTRTAASLNLAGEKALLVAADSATVETFRAFLSGWGAETHNVADVSRGLAILAGGAADYLASVIDLSGSENTAEVLARALASNRLPSSARFAILTGMDTAIPHAIIEDGRLMATIGKPVRQSALARMLRQAQRMIPDRSRPVAAPPGPRPLPAASGDAGSKVLVVDDSPVNQMVAKGLLARLGCEVVTADNGVKALAALRDADYALVFMDCQMPEMDGYQAAREIRRPGSPARNPAIPIIAMTANAMAGDKEKCLEAGMDDYLAKPVRAEELRQMLQKWTVAGK